MRGLTGAGPNRARVTFQAVITAGAVFAAVALFVSACSTGGTGTRDEGAAHASASTVEGAAATPSPTPSPSATLDRVNAVKLVMADPQVSAAVKRELKPCGKDYPVDVFYGNLTGGVASDVVVNVLSCGEAIGIGSYVYREQNGTYKNVFRAEEPPVYSDIDRGDLVVTKQVYEKGDPVSSPSSEDVITYRWVAGRFAEEYRTHHDYSNAVGGDASAVPDTN